MVDTKRDLDAFTNASTGLFKNNNDGDISAQDLRDFVISTYGNGALYSPAAETASFTGVVGELHPVTVTTAQITVTFPSVGLTAGDTFGYFVETQSTTAGSFALAPGKAIEPANATVINNESYTALATGTGKWGLWLNSECLIFRYVDATVGWQVVHDGRLPLTAKVDKQASQSLASGTVTAVVLDNVVLDNVNAFNSTNDTLEVKRSNTYSVRGAIRSAGLTAAGTYRFSTRIGTTLTGAEVTYGEQNIAGTSGFPLVVAHDIVELTASGTSYIALSIFQELKNPDDFYQVVLSYREVL